VDADADVDHVKWDVGVDPDTNPNPKSDPKPNTTRGQLHKSG